MFNSVIVGDIIGAIWWATCRIAPTWTYFWAMQYIREDKLALGMFLLTLVYCAVMTLILFISNTWPTLFLRYQARLQTRTITMHGATFHQVKLFGLWHFISIVDDECMLSLSKWFTPTGHRESSRFDAIFQEFINAHHKRAVINVRSQKTYIRGDHPSQ